MGGGGSGSGKGGASVAHRCDMLAADEVEAAVQACLARFGAVDILVNNVGGSHPGTPADMPEQVWDQLWSLVVEAGLLKKPR